MGKAPLVLQVTASTQAPIIFIFKSSTIGMVPFAEHWNVTDTYFRLMKLYFYLTGNFDNICFIEQL